MGRRTRVAAAAVAFSLLAGHAAGQVAAVPMAFSPSAQPGVRVFGDFAYGGDPSQRSFGGRVQLNLAYATVNVLAADQSDGGTAKGASLALNLLRGASRRLSLSVDAGWGESRVRDDDTETIRRDVPFGIAVALEPEVPGIDLEPWAGARVIFRRNETDEVGLAPEETTGFGLSAGVNLRTGVLEKLGLPLPGFGLHAAVELASVAGPWDRDRTTAFSFSLGLNYLFELRGFPPYGIIRPPCDPTEPC